jgi:hypothetical protein
MKKSQASATTAKNLEDKFDQGEDVLDYFDVSKARVIRPEQKSAAKTKFAYSLKENSQRRALVRDKSARYREDKR